MQNYIVTPEFKQRVTDILNTKKFTTVFPWMNLINREGFVYSEAELNQLVQFLGDFPYIEVSEFFNLLPTLVNSQETSQADQTDAPQTDETQCCESPEDCKECETATSSSEN
jgi:hypothetical protein